MTVDPTDNLIVQRGSTLGTIEVQNMATIQNNDLLVVGRGSDSFKITGQDFKNSIAGGIDLQGSAVVAPTVADIGDTLTCTASAAGGTAPYTFDYQWFCQLDGAIDWQEHPGSNTDTVVLDAGDIDYRFRCHVTVTGANGGTLSLISNETGVIGDPAVAPIIGNVSLVESNPDADPRFTDQEFVVNVTMTEDGEPVSTKKIDAYVEGSITTQVQFDEPLESSSTTTFYSNQRSTNVFEADGTGENVALNGIDGNTNTRWFATTNNNSDSTIEVDITNPVTCATGTVHVLMSTANVGNYYHELLINGTGYPMDTPGSTIWDGSFMQGPNILVPVPVNIPAGTVISSLGIRGKANAHPNFYCIDLNGNPNPVLASDFKWLSLTSNDFTSLQFAAGTDMSMLEAGDTVEQGATNGTVGSITDTTVTLSSSSGTWTDGVNVTGPEKTIVGSNTKKYLKFDSSGNVTDLQDAPQSPAYETTDENPQLTLKFPSTFPSGNAPDDELGEGTKLTVEATATNDAGTSGPETAEVQPEGTPLQPDGPDLNGLTGLYAGSGGERNYLTGVNLVENDALVWIKTYTGTNIHCLFDTIRGAGKPLFSSTADSEASYPYSLMAFLQNGFKLGADVNVNGAGSNYVAWTFQKSPEYFDIVKQNVNSGDTVISHNLSRSPHFIIGKPINTADNWFCWHVGIPTSKYLTLNTVNAAQDATIYSLINENNFTLKNGSATGVAGEWIFYIFASNPDVGIKCNAVATNTWAELGFEPQWILIKQTDSQNSWAIYDYKRGWGKAQLLDNDGAQVDLAITVLGTQFQIAANTWGAGNYIYMAIAKPTTRSLTQEEFNEQAIKFGTYEHRKHVECARLSEENRDALIQYFADQGYSLQDILTYL